MHLIAVPLLIYALTMQVVGNSGTIQGTACELDGCRPIAGVRISLQLPNSAGTRQTVSTETGAFIFRGLPPGRYQLEAEADGFSPVAVLPLVTLSEGGRVDDLRVLMRPLGSIMGHAFDVNGEPLRNARVDAMVFERGLHLPVLTPVSSTSTDDRGEFRMRGLAADEYYIRVTPPLRADVADIFPATFYPDALNLENAVKIAVGGGSERSDISIRIPRRGVAITGGFVTQEGKPTRAVAYLIPRLTSQFVGPTFSAEGSSDGFEIRGVPPGSYFLYAVTDPGHLNGVPVDRLPPQWVRAPIDVANDDIKNLRIQVAPTGSIIGRIVFSPDTIDPSSLDLSKVLIEAGPIEVTPGPSENYLAASVSKSGDFRFDHLPEMTLFLWNARLNDDWFVSRLLFEGTDVMSSGFSAAPGQDRLLEVVVSNAGGHLEGTITNATNNPVRAGRIVLLPAPGLRLNPSLLRIVLADDQGRFEIESILPGEYTAIAFPPETQLGDVHWMEQYERFGQHVQISPRQNTRIDLVTSTVTPN
jgi:Carboxypeptidase regulatory-like domain